MLEGERNKAIEIAKSMLVDNNIDIKIISKHTEFTEEGIEEIKKVWGCNIEYHK